MQLPLTRCTDNILSVCGIKVFFFISGTFFLSTSMNFSLWPIIVFRMSIIVKDSFVFFFLGGKVSNNISREK